MKATAYPLCWPVGHVRTPAHERKTSIFGTSHWDASKRTTLAEVVALLQKELDRLGAREPILSTNIETRLDGLPRSGTARPADPGVAVYFKLNGKDIVLPSDRWAQTECNIMAMVKHIEATRGMARWGVGTVERCFDGFAALPERGTQQAWWEVLQVSAHATADEIEKAFRLLALVAHPDQGGTTERFSAIVEARDQGLMVARGCAVSH